MYGYGLTQISLIIKITQNHRLKMIHNETRENQHTHYFDKAHKHTINQKTIIHQYQMKERLMICK